MAHVPVVHKPEGLHKNANVLSIWGPADRKSFFDEIEAVKVAQHFDHVEITCSAYGKITLSVWRGEVHAQYVNSATVAPGTFTSIFLPIEGVEALFEVFKQHGMARHWMQDGFEITWKW